MAGTFQLTSNWTASVFKATVKLHHHKHISLIVKQNRSPCQSVRLRSHWRGTTAGAWLPETKQKNRTELFTAHFTHTPYWACLTSFLWWYVSPTLMCVTKFPPVRASWICGTVTTRSKREVPSASSASLSCAEVQLHVNILKLSVRI